MPSPIDAVLPLARDAISRVIGVPADEVDPVVRESQFADIQLNAALALARREGVPPRELAQRIVAELPEGGPIGSAEISGPGYINILLDDAWIARHASELDVAAEHPATGRRVVIDYSSPNVAKEMHVGHLRTTVVGDALARIHEQVGDQVIRQNHIGDWGTPFGMLIEHSLDIEAAGGVNDVAESPNVFYQAARSKFDEDANDFAQRSRNRVVALQAGEPDTMELWRELVARSTTYFHAVYETLDISLTDEDLAGESSYNDELAALCDELESRGIARISNGALCAFPEGFTGRDGGPAALIIRKSDGGYGYATTDLATVRHRVRDLHADEVLYVVGEPQSTHFEMVWTVAREAGWVDDSVQLVHVKIGSVLGSDNKMLKTRSGDSFKLLDLVEMSIERAEAVLEQTGGITDPEERREVARMIGVGAVKYADLSVSHDTEYVFDLERMVSLTGNTAPYLQYAVARIRSLLARAAEQDGVVVGDAVEIGLPEERALAIALLGFESAVQSAATLHEPHRLCAYLFGLAQRFSSFYDAAPVLSAEPEVRASRLLLCRRTEEILDRGLAVLGIRTPRRM